MAAAIATRILHDSGIDAFVWSRGSRPGGFPAISKAAAVMADRGLDLSQHVSSQLSEADVAEADLILTVEPVLLGDIGTFDSQALNRAFTIPELARVTRSLDPRDPSETIQQWVALCNGSRRERDRQAGEIPDPTGKWSKRAFAATASQLESYLREILHSAFPQNVPRS